MPQTIHKTFYACDKCGLEHNDLQNAITCENLPLLEEMNGNNLQQFNVGDTIDYNNEEGSYGSRWIYSGKSGKIIEKRLIVSTNNQDGTKQHQYLYWVEDNEIMIRDGVLWSKNEFGWLLFSPAELKRRM